MPYKDPEKRKAYAKQYQSDWYSRNKERHKETTRRNQRRYRDEWEEFKGKQKCFKCEFSHPAAIDFHHINRNDPDKLRVNQLVSQKSYKKAIKEATEKCIPLCSNCHRILHWEEHYDVDVDT